MNCAVQKSRAILSGEFLMPRPGLPHSQCNICNLVSALVDVPEVSNCDGFRVLVAITSVISATCACDAGRLVMRDLTDAILSGVAPVFALLATPFPFALVAEHISKWEDTGGTNPEEGDK